MFCSRLCSTLVGMLLAVMLAISGINGQMRYFYAYDPETPLPLNGPIQFQTIEGNATMAYSNGSITIPTAGNYDLTTRCSYEQMHRSGAPYFSFYSMILHKADGSFQGTICPTRKISFSFWRNGFHRCTYNKNFFNAGDKVSVHYNGDWPYTPSGSCFIEIEQIPPTDQ